MSTEWLLTIGSARQSGEFLEAARRHYNWDVAHVVEEAASWRTKSVDQLLVEARAHLDRHGRAPAAIMNFGRATVPYGIDAIAAVCEQLVALPALAGTKVVGPSYRAASIFSDKWKTFEALQQGGFSVPATQEITAENLDQVRKRLQDAELSLPRVLKVTDLTGGSGMESIVKPGDLASAYGRLNASERKLILSEFVDGDEISFDVLRLGRDCLVYPPGLKRRTDLNLTHADHKIKVNGLIANMTPFADEVRGIVEYLDVQGFFSIEGAVTRLAPLEWKIFEATTRVTNNFQMQSASIDFDGFAAVSRYLRREKWLPSSEKALRLALSLPIYQHRGHQSVADLEQLPWVLQVKLENLAEMPLTRDNRERLTVKMKAETDLLHRLKVVEEATGDRALSGRVRAELERLSKAYPAYSVGSGVVD